MAQAIPIASLPGIPAPVARRLRALGLAASADLLRADPVKLARALSPAATLDDVHTWRSIASLLEIEAMTPAWAAALVRRDVNVASALSLRKLSSVRTLFAEAVQAGEIPALPNDDQIAALQLDSMCLKHTGVLNVTVVDKQEKPLRGATVAWGRSQEKSDARGRVRLLRLPLESAFDLVVHKSGYADQRKKDLRASAPQLLVGQKIELSKHSARARPKRKLLSQFAGDEIGSLDGRRFHQVTAKSRKLRRGDLVRWVETFANGDVKLSSRFLDDDGEQIIVRAWRLPRTTLPANAALRDDFSVTRAGLVPIQLSSRRLTRLRILRTLLRGAKTPSNATEFVRRAREVARKLRRAGAFTRGF